MFIFFFLNDTAPTEIYPLSLHDALPICGHKVVQVAQVVRALAVERKARVHEGAAGLQRAGRLPAEEVQRRSEEHTSELQSLAYLVCRLLLEKKKNKVRRDNNLQSSLGRS